MYHCVRPTPQLITWLSKSGTRGSAAKANNPIEMELLAGQKVGGLCEERLASLEFSDDEEECGLHPGA